MNELPEFEVKYRVMNRYGVTTSGIAELGGDDWNWSREVVARKIDHHEAIFYVDLPRPLMAENPLFGRIELTTEPHPNGVVVKTIADGLEENNLLRLPELLSGGVSPANLLAEGLMGGAYR